MELLRQFIDVFLHLDQHLAEWATQMGGWLYVLLFAIIFAETGLVVTPFLPGDSLLFAVGALTAVEGSPLSLGPVIILLIVAGVLGDATNYSIGYRLGEKVFQSETSKLLNKKHLLRTQAFYQKHGGKTIIIARFIPIIRTFAPFVAGIGKMHYPRFAIYNITGAISWVVIFTCLGHWFGNQPFIKRNFQYVILGIIVISVLPAVIEFLRARSQAAKAREAGTTESPSAPPPTS
jgi:membrane-associated protein